MPTETAAPAESAPAPVTAPTSAPAAPVTPPIPAAQQATLPKPAGRVPPTNQPMTPPPTVEAKLSKLAKEVFKDAPENAPDKAAAPAVPAESDQAPEAKAEPATPAKADAALAAAKDAFESMELPAGASEAQKSNFKALKAQAAEEVNRLKNERATLTKELETYKKATPADRANEERLASELKSAQDRLAVYDVSSHPDFVRQYVEPKKKALGIAESLANDYALTNASELKALIDLPRPEFAKRLTEMAAAMPAFDQNKFFTSMDEARNLQQQEAGALTKAGELRAGMQAKAAQEARTAFEASRGEFSQRIPVMEIPDGANEETIKEVTAFNKAREQALSEAETLTFGSMNERQTADVAVQAAALKMVATHQLPMMERQLKEARAIIASQNEQLKGIAAKKNPGASASSSNDHTASAPKNLKDLARQVFGNQG